MMSGNIGHMRSILYNKHIINIVPSMLQNVSVASCLNIL